MNKTLFLIYIAIFMSNIQPIIGSYPTLQELLTPKMQEEIDSLTPKYKAIFYHSRNAQEERLRACAKKYQDANPKNTTWMDALDFSRQAIDGHEEKQAKLRNARLLLQDMINFHLHMQRESLNSQEMQIQNSQSATTCKNKPFTVSDPSAFKPYEKKSNSNKINKVIK